MHERARVVRVDRAPRATLSRHMIAEQQPSEARDTAYAAAARNHSSRLPACASSIWSEVSLQSARAQDKGAGPAALLMPHACQCGGVRRSSTHSDTARIDLDERCDATSSIAETANGEGPPRPHMQCMHQHASCSKRAQMHMQRQA